LAAFLRLYRIDSLPPSDGYDQATYGLDVLDILDGARPIFLPTNFGREALFSYLVTLCYLVIGDAATAVYATSALVGTLTVPAVYLAAEELFADEKGALAQWGGLLAALALAISRWHLSWSRLGMRAILVPFFAAVTVYLLWRGLRTGSRWAFLGCGLSLGLSMHSYQAARALPLLVLLGYAYVALARRSFTRRDVLNLVLIVVAALVVFAPLGIYFLTHPGSSGLRIGQAVVVRSSQQTGENLRILLDQGLKAVRALFFQGDEDGRVNVPGWPALDPFTSVALLLGMAFSVLRLKRPAYPLLLTWLVGLSAPALLAQYGPVTKRAIGATPAVAMLVAVGCLATWDAVRLWAERRHPSWTRGLGVGLALFIGAGFAYSGVQCYRHYFSIWPQDPNLFTHFETGQTAIGRYIKDRPPEERIYLSPVPVDHHSVALNSGRRPGVKSYHGKFCFVAVDGAPQDATYVIVPAEDVNSLPLLTETLPQGSVVDQGPLHYNQPYFLAYHVPAGTHAQVAPGHVQTTNWGDKIELLGYDLEKKVYQPGETLHLTLYYRPVAEVVADQMVADYTVFIHLLGPDNPATGSPLWAQDDSEPCRRSYRTSAWGPNEIVIDHYAITVPPDAPEGEYPIAMGLYEWQTLQRLPVLDDAGQVVGDHVVLTVVDVESGE
jgi:4-amino-4-deoxy-L-arabinose transferase-like glycosyltransferase